MWVAMDCHRWANAHQAAGMAGMAVKDARSGAATGEVWRREQGRGSRRDGSRYNHLSYSHRLGEGRER